MEIFNCRLCGGELRTVLDLGSLYISGFVTSKNVSEKEPLALATCKVCGFAQLKHIVDPDKMYRQYWYKSSLNPSMMDDLKDIVDSIVTLLDRGSECTIALDIGANDGSMLAMYPPNYIKIGFDPALNLEEDAKNVCDWFVPDYFTAEKYPHGFGKANIVTAIAMFYDLNNPRAFLEDVYEVLADNGIFVVQMTDLISMLQANAFDNICHEHAGYYTLVQICDLFRQHHLEVFDVEYNKVNGGSVRVYAQKRNGPYEVSGSVNEEVGREERYLQSFTDPFMAFSTRVMNIGLSILRYVLTCAKLGRTVYGLGASTKGNTLLQYFRLDQHSIKAIGEVNEDKFGKKTVGTNIPIIPENLLLELRPDILLILPWHFRDFFVDKFEQQMSEGTKLLFPLPMPELVYIHNGKLRIERIDLEKSPDGCYS